MSLPPTHRALILDAIGQPLRVDTTHPTPQPTPGSAIIQILASGILSYSRDIYNGVRKYTLPTPSIPGSSAIGRIVSLGQDATTLKIGDLVLCDIFVHARDDFAVGALLGIHDGHSLAAKGLMHGEWRDGTYAEYARLPLENCFVLDEQRLLSSSSSSSSSSTSMSASTENNGLGKSLGYTVDDLLHFAAVAVPFGGLRSVGLAVGETVVVSPATGMFGSGAVHVALAMGANVIAMGRNEDALAKLKTDTAAGGHHIETVRITNDVQHDLGAIINLSPGGKGVDVFFDISPPAAGNSTHFKSGILSLKRGGRASFMGGYRSDDIGLPLGEFVHRDLTLKGKWMYDREDIVRLIRLVESGRLRFGADAGFRVVARYGLEQWEEAFDAAAEQAGPGQVVAIVP